MKAKKKRRGATAGGRRTLTELTRDDIRMFQKNVNIGVLNPECKIRRNLLVYSKPTW